jgi:hypothetical protein
MYIEFPFTGCKCINYYSTNVNSLIFIGSKHLLTNALKISIIHEPDDHHPPALHFKMDKYIWKFSQTFDICITFIKTNLIEILLITIVVITFNLHCHAQNSHYIWQAP